MEKLKKNENDDEKKTVDNVIGHVWFWFFGAFTATTKVDYYGPFILYAIW